MALIAQLGEHCTGIAEVVGSNPAQSLNFFQVSVLVVFNGRTCINYRYHSIATMGQITFKNMFVIVKHSLSLSLLLTWKSPVNNFAIEAGKNRESFHKCRSSYPEMFGISELFTD